MMNLYVEIKKRIAVINALKASSMATSFSRTNRFCTFENMVQRSTFNRILTYSLVLISQQSTLRQLIRDGKSRVDQGEEEKIIKGVEKEHTVKYKVNNRTPTVVKYKDKVKVCTQLHDA